MNSALETAQGILEEPSLLEPNFRQTDYTPKLVRFEPDSYCKVPPAKSSYMLRKMTR